MIVALVILVLLTIIGISATSTTDIETQIAGNEKFQKIAFSDADSGIQITAKLISSILDAQTQPEIGSVKYLKPGSLTEADDADSVLARIMGYTTNNAGAILSSFTTPEVTYKLGTSDSASVDIERTRTENLAGGSAGYGEGYGGIGEGSSGGVAIYYAIDSAGSGPAKSKSEIAADYKKVVGVAGGL